MALFRAGGVVVPRLIVASLLSLVLAGCGSTPGPTATPISAIPTASSTASPTATIAPSLAPSVSPSPAMVDVIPAGAFTTPTPPSASSVWATIRWQRLASTDPLTLVRRVLRWRGGLIAVGWDASSTPVWTSRNGAHWEPLPFNTATTFWPGLLVVGVGEVRSGLVALTVLAGPNDCGGASDCQTYGSTVPLMSWTSPDGRTWTPHTGPDLGPPSQWRAAPVLAAGPSGLLAASTGTAARLATSVDGIAWRTVPSGALPTGLAITDIVGTSGGFAAVGALMVSADHERAVAFQSVDGVAWAGPYPLHLVSASGIILASTGTSWGATALVAARRGLIAVGVVFATPGGGLWWQSAHGRDWRALPTYPPLGPTTCTGEGCGGQANGALVGDGERMVALRGGVAGGVWTSSDGLTWRRLAVAGDLPSEQATQAVLLPGGVLLSDGTTTWFGEAEGR
ncbi:MAG: hypothetical protein ACYDCI_02945 [Candidatus Limnocylindrales bacterium]